MSFFGNSDTYHLWALIGAYNVARYDSAQPQRDTKWLSAVWDNYQRGVAASTAKVHASSGLFAVTEGADWARGGQGGENCPANML